MFVKNGRALFVWFFVSAYQHFLKIAMLQQVFPLITILFILQFPSNLLL